MFVPFLFTSHALRYNGIRYENPPKQRHSYLKDKHNEYRDELQGNFLCEHGLWGSSLHSNVVFWKPQRGVPPYSIDLPKIGQFFAVNHSLIRDHPYFALASSNITTHDDIIVCKAKKEFIEPLQE